MLHRLCMCSVLGHLFVFALEGKPLKIKLQKMCSTLKYSIRLIIKINAHSIIPAQSLAIDPEWNNICGLGPRGLSMSIDANVILWVPLLACSKSIRVLFKYIPCIRWFL